MTILYHSFWRIKSSFQYNFCFILQNEEINSGSEHQKADKDLSSPEVHDLSDIDEVDLSLWVPHHILEDMNDYDKLQATNRVELYLRGRQLSNSISSLM